MKKNNLTWHEATYQSNDEVYMPKRVEDYFKNKLVIWREELEKSCSKEKTNRVDIRSNSPTIHLVNNMNVSGSQIEQAALEKYLLNEINAALYRIENGTYGCCEKTGDPLSFECLEKWPIARYAR